MFKKLVTSFEKKSPIERFLLVMGVLLFLLYLVMGVFVVFWEYLLHTTFPFVMEMKWRWAFGILLVVYSGIRFVRFLKDNTEDDE